MYKNENILVQYNLDTECKINESNRIMKHINSQWKNIYGLHFNPTIKILTFGIYDDRKHHMEAMLLFNEKNDTIWYCFSGNNTKVYGRPVHSFKLYDMNLNDVLVDSFGDFIAFHQKVGFEPNAITIKDPEELEIDSRENKEIHEFAMRAYLDNVYSNKNNIKIWSARLEYMNHHNFIVSKQCESYLRMGRPKKNIVNTIDQNEGKRFYFVRHGRVFAKEKIITDGFVSIPPTDATIITADLLQRFINIFNSKGVRFIQSDEKNKSE